MERGHPYPHAREARTMSVLRTLAGRDARAPSHSLMNQIQNRHQHRRGR